MFKKTDKEPCGQKMCKTNNTAKDDNFFTEETLGFSFELINEDVLDEKFEEAVEEGRKLISIVLAITAFFELEIYYISIVKHKVNYVLFYISNLGQAPTLRVACIFKIFRAQSRLAIG